VDVDALVAMVVRLSVLPTTAPRALDRTVIVSPSGCLAVDALVVPRST
jgi:hypothetical protein